MPQTVKNSSDNPMCMGQPYFADMNSESAGGQDSAQIESKNLDILKDQMNHEAIAYKKCSIYSEYFMDQTLRNLANTAAQHHKQHFDSLLSYLNCHE